MTIRKFLLSLWIFTWLLGGCDSGGPDQEENEAQSTPLSAASGEPNRFDGVWEVTGRTGNEDGANEPVCGNETGLGTVTIQASEITGNITNKSGFEYSVEGTIDNSGKIKAMLIYSGYDAAELFGTFSAETNSAKGNWKDAVNACPGVWTAIRTASAAPAAPVKPEENRENISSEPEQVKQSG